MVSRGRGLADFRKLSGSARFHGSAFLCVDTVSIQPDGRWIDAGKENGGRLPLGFAETGDDGFDGLHFGVAALPDPGLVELPELRSGQRSVGKSGVSDLKIFPLRKTNLFNILKSCFPGSSVT